MPDVGKYGIFDGNGCGIVWFMFREIANVIVRAHNESLLSMNAQGEWT